ncbi:MAG: hypothetical protein Q9160_007299 [Pyrenula sp. 1 TL-2023]
MSNAQGQRIRAYCEAIWGKGDYMYDIDVETDDWEIYQGFVKQDFRLEYGPILTGTRLCKLVDHVYSELERMLSAWARQVQSGRPMTKEEELYIFWGLEGQNRKAVEEFSKELEKREKRGRA